MTYLTSVKKEEKKGKGGLAGDDMLSFETGIYCKVGTGCVARREGGADAEDRLGWNGRVRQWAGQGGGVTDRRVIGNWRSRFRLDHRGGKKRRTRKR